MSAENPLSDYVTTDELAKMLGVVPHTILDWARRHGLPVIKITNKVHRYSIKEVTAWLEERNVNK